MPPKVYKLSRSKSYLRFISVLHFIHSVGFRPMLGLSVLSTYLFSTSDFSYVLYFFYVSYVFLRFSKLLMFISFTLLHIHVLYDSYVQKIITYDYVFIFCRLSILFTYSTFSTFNFFLCFSEYFLSSLKSFLRFAHYLLLHFSTVCIFSVVFYALNAFIF